MAVFREITIEFDGNEYTFVPSNKLLRRIDAELAPQTLFGVLNLMDGQQTPLPALACIISMMLQAGGAKVTEDDVLQEFYKDMTENEGNGIRPLVEAIGACITMPSAPMGNGGQPDPVRTKKAKKAKRPKKAKEEVLAQPE